jgi:hypothetical protein
MIDGMGLTRPTSFQVLLSTETGARESQLEIRRACYAALRPKTGMLKSKPRISPPSKTSKH